MRSLVNQIFTPYSVQDQTDNEDQDKNKILPVSFNEAFKAEVLKIFIRPDLQLFKQVINRREICRYAPVKIVLQRFNFQDGSRDLAANLRRCVRSCRQRPVRIKASTDFAWKIGRLLWF